MKSPKENAKDKGEPKSDLFENLRNRNISDIKKELYLLEKENNQLDERFQRLGAELQHAIELEKLIADVIDNDEHRGKTTEAKSLARQLKKTHIEIVELENFRNDINKNIVLDLNRCENELLRTYERLTGEIDVFRVPSIQKEEEVFSHFFELQEMVKLMAQADEAHKKILDVSKLQYENLKQLKSINSEISESFESAIQDEEILKDVDINYTSLIEIRKSVFNIKKMRTKLYQLRRKSRREHGRLLAYVKHIEKPKMKQQKPRTHSGPSSLEVKEKVSSGDSLSLQELDVFLKSGGLKNFSEQHTNANNLTRKKKKQKSSVQVARGKPAKSTKGMKD